MHIQLGSTVRDAISGFTGIATQIAEYLNGNLQYGLQPKAKEDGSDCPESHFIDYHTLDVIDAGVSDRSTEPAETDILLGQKVRDKASGFEGIATLKMTYINGCVSFGVLPKASDNKSPKPIFVDHARLEVVDDGLLSDKPRTDEIKSSRPPGGPSMKQPKSI